MTGFTYLLGGPAFSEFVKQKLVDDLSRRAGREHLFTAQFIYFIESPQALSQGEVRRLEALLAVADKKVSLIISGNGDVIEPEHDFMAIGSGGPYAQAAAMALLQNTDLEARDIAEQALNIAGEICVFTNQNIIIEELP